MRRKSLLVVGLVLLVATVLVACEGSFSTANIRDAYMATDSDGANKTTEFLPNQIFYCIVELANAPDDTVVKAVWLAADVEGIEPNFLIDEVELTYGSGTLTFNLSSDQFWPEGTYQVELYLNGELDRTLEFTVRR